MLRTALKSPRMRREVVELFLFVWVYVLVLCYENLLVSVAYIYKTRFVDIRDTVTLKDVTPMALVLQVMVIIFS
ncbi:uncharacterized protein A4U43_C09F8010 [Asparagus officinalis]|uniref:Uncharacterized protein n=1 Tax=Asparagus officinalis TaxID=4686 RepID=A0A5P1E6B4_ASPOF|nr:uncharacterized protein A4U43_C09F8010 [Asparagus officinalis]